MATYFLDSSAIVKRYVNEPGSAWVVGLTSQTAGNDLYVVPITGAEVVSALVRHNPPIRAASLATALAQFRTEFFNRYQQVDISETLVRSAMQLAEHHRLRGYDAVQLAGAKELHGARLATSLPAIIFVSSDTNLNNAAMAQGLVIDNPRSHP